MNLTSTSPDTATTEREAHTGWPGRLEAVESFLALLAKAVRQVHAYPVTSQVCLDAVNACRSHLSSMEGSDETTLTVTPDYLLLHEHPLGDAPFVKHELTRRLRRARVSAITVNHGCSARDLTRFCVNLLRCSESADTSLSVAELMAEDGVEAISVEVISRRQVLPVAPSGPAQRDLVAHERRRRDEGAPPNTRSVHLFPPHRGWIRLDPAERFDAVSLSDLAILVEDPNELAALLDRLVEDGQAGSEARAALERRFGDVASLFAGLEPRLSRVMFGKLARVVLAMETEVRNAVLTRSVLPAIFDGRPAANVLHAFEDAELAEALCLLFDIATGASAVALSALEGLRLDEERRARVLPLMHELMQARIDPALGLDAAAALALDQQARRLTRIDARERRSFVELAGFDFRVDDDARTGIATVCDRIRETDGTTAELACLVNLVGLQPNPEVAATFVASAVDRASHLAAAGRWAELAVGLEHLASVTRSLRERRPEVTALVDDALNAFANQELAAALIATIDAGDGPKAVALRIVDALGTSIAPSLLSLLESEPGKAAGAVSLMCERAGLFSQALADSLASSPARVRPHIARVLGYAGPGFEDALGQLCDRKDEKTTREALRGLSRIATARAAEIVGGLAADARDWMATATIETLLRFPADTGAAPIRDVLGHKSFVLAQPAAASRLLGRAGHARGPQLDTVLRGIWSLRFRFWNRALVKVAREAGEMLRA